MDHPDWTEDPHGGLGLTRIVNAAGTYTPLGVSRSGERVARAAATALRHWFVIDELQELLGRRLAGFAGSQAAAVCHCASAGITLCVAAARAGTDPDRVRRLPDADDLPRGVVLPAGHAVDYGHPITQDIRLAGGVPVPAGADDGCSLEDLESALSAEGVAALLLVSSRLTRGQALDLAAAVRLAHRRGVPAIVDGAAQDRRVRELVATGCDALVVSGHKYLASPTAGMVFGTEGFIRAFRAQERGIGRAMKATKEALLGLLAALEAREQEDERAWQSREMDRARRVAARIDALPGLNADLVADPAGLPLDRVRVGVDPALAGLDARALATRLADGRPSVRVMQHEIAAGRLVLELADFRSADEEALLDALQGAVGRG
jgi:L-seryl-tRNA(Ser) seleniumtransferase